MCVVCCTWFFLWYRLKIPLKILKNQSWVILERQICFCVHLKYRFLSQCVGVGSCNCCYLLLRVVFFYSCHDLNWVMVTEIFPTESWPSDSRIQRLIYNYSSSTRLLAKFSYFLTKIFKGMELLLSMDKKEQ